MSSEIRERHIEAEIAAAAELSSEGKQAEAFRHLERAHVLGQSSTYQHTRVHWLMLKHGVANKDVRAVAGQAVRIAGAATKTPLGLIPAGNTGGANVSPFRRMPIPDDLKEVLDKASN